MRTARRIVPFLAALLWLLAAAPAQSQAPLSLAEYAARLDQAIALATRAASLSAAERAPLLNEAADLLDAVRAVQLDNGQTATVDNSALARRLRLEPEPAPLLDRLRALRASLDRLPAASSPADRARLRDLLNRPPFKDSQDPFWVQLMQQLDEFIGRLLRGAGEGILEWRDVVAAAGVFLVLLIAGYLIWNLRKNAVPDTRLAGEEDGEAGLTSAAALSRAQQLAAGGDYRSAVRQLYLATLLLLDERGRIRFDHALTNREYLQQAAREPALATALAPIVEVFDRVWYGFERVTPADLDAYQRQVEEVRRQTVL